MSDLTALEHATPIDRPHTGRHTARISASDHEAVLTEIAGRGIVHVAGAQQTFDKLPLPQTPNRCTARDETLAAWVGPRRWLLIGSDDDAERWLSIEDAGAAVADMSQSRSVVHVGGRQWRELLSYGCPLDAETAFPPDQWSCAQSVFCEVPVFALAPPHGQWLELHAPSSYRAFFWNMLEASARPLGYRIAPRASAPGTFTDPLSSTPGQDELG